MTAAAQPLVVIGMGNVLLRDDAAGVRVVERLRTLVGDDPAVVPPGTRLVDGGTLGLDLLPALAGARGLVLVDATAGGDDPGTVRVHREGAIAAAGGGHAGRAPDAVGALLTMARLLGWLPERVALVSIEADEIAVGIGLSPQVAAALPAAMDAVRRELDVMDELGTTTRTGTEPARRLAGALA